METGNILQMARAYSSIKDYTNNGECSKCGNCCGRILPLTQLEINQIKAYIKKHNIKRHIHITNVLAEASIDAMCPFLDDTKIDKCTIYEVRPSICRVYNCHKHITGELFDEPHFYKKHTIVDALKTFFPES